MGEIGPGGRSGVRCTHPRPHRLLDEARVGLAGPRPRFRPSGCDSTKICATACHTAYAHIGRQAKLRSLGAFRLNVHQVKEKYTTPQNLSNHHRERGLNLVFDAHDIRWNTGRKRPRLRARVAHANERFN